MAKKRYIGIGIFTAIILVAIGHFIYRERVIQDCGCGYIFEYIDCEENDMECRMRVKQSVKKNEEECKRESVSCKFLYNCRCRY